MPGVFEAEVESAGAQMTGPPEGFELRRNLSCLFSSQDILAAELVHNRLQGTRVEAERLLRRLLQTKQGPVVAWSREGARWGEVVRIHMYVEAFADGPSMSLRDTEAKSDSKGSGLSNDGIDTNSNGDNCGRRKDEALSLEPVRRETPITHPSGGVEWDIESMSLEFRRKSGLERHISERSAGTYTVWHIKPLAWVTPRWRANI